MSKEDIGITIFAIGIIVVFAGVGTYVYKSCTNGGCSTATTATSSSPVAKPATITRCDYTGVMASSIINEESEKGYQFAGRIHTFLCGDNGLSFYLRTQ